jgi:hypothetical protein
MYDEKDRPKIDGAGIQSFFHACRYEPEKSCIFAAKITVVMRFLLLFLQASASGNNIEKNNAVTITLTEKFTYDVLHIPFGIFFFGKTD